MDDVAFMRELQRAASLLHDAQRARQGKRMAAIEQRLQALSLNQLHGDVVEAVFFAASNTTTMFGCVNKPAARASVWNRDRSSGRESLCLARSAGWS